MPPDQAVDLSIRPSIKRQGSMENLKESDESKTGKDEEKAEFSDYDELLVESKYHLQ